MTGVFKPLGVPETCMRRRAPLAPLAEQLRSGRRTVEDVLSEVRDRIDEIEPEVQAFVPEAARGDRINDAVQSLVEGDRGPGTRPTLYGVPVGVKDIFHVDGLPTRAGASVSSDELGGPQATTVEALRAAGAYTLGKTVTTEFAYYDPGPTRNPNDLDHTPGGSSSGSAAGVAAGLVPLALGTQTYGSVARPASFCGVVGVKPSYDRISREGVLDLSPSADHVGFFTQDVAGARMAASVLYEEWRPLHSLPSPTIGVTDGPYLEQAEPVMREHIDEEVQRLETAGYAVTRLQLFDNIEEINRRHHRMVAAEAALTHDTWYEAYGDEYGAELSNLIQEGYDVPAKELAVGRSGRGELRTAISRRMDENNIDLILSPSAPGPAPAGLDDTGDPVMNVPFTHSGVPTVTLPTGSIDGLPLGVQLSARYGFDEWLLAWADDISETLLYG